MGNASKTWVFIVAVFNVIVFLTKLLIKLPRLVIIECAAIFSGSCFCGDYIFCNIYCELVKGNVKFLMHTKHVK